MLKHEVAYQGDYAIVHIDDFKMLCHRSVEVDLKDSTAASKGSNKRTPERVHEQALELIESSPEIFNKLLEVAEECVRNDEYFSLVDEVYNLQSSEEKAAGDDKEAKKAVRKKYARWKDSSILACVIREMIIRVPGLEDLTRIRNCDFSKFYPQLRRYEGGHQTESIRESQLRNNPFAYFSKADIQRLKDEMGPEWNG